MQWLRSLVFTSFFFLWTAFYAVFFAIAVSVVPYRTRFAVTRGWGIVLVFALKWICRLDHRVEGGENIPAGSHVALIKHSSSWETFTQALLLPPQAWVLKRELTWIPLIGWGMRRIRAIAVDRGAGHIAVKSVLEQGRARLAEGLWVVIFPEGTRMAPGTTRKYGISGALLACETGKYIVPVAHNAGFYWRRRSVYKKAGTIRVRIGKPIVTAGRDPREVNTEAQAWIEANSQLND